MGHQAEREAYSKFDIDSPDWAKNDLSHSWYSEGIVVWDETEKTVVNLDFWNAMDLLDHLCKNQKWQERGQNISEERIEFSFEIKRRKRSNDASLDEQSPAETNSVITTLHLSPQRTQTLLDFLEQNKQIIRGRGTISEDEHNRGIKLLVKLLHKERSRRRDQEG